MARILALERLYNLSDEQMEYPLLDRTSYERFCGLANATTVRDRTTVWTFENRIGEAGGEGAVRWRISAVADEGFHRTRQSDHRRDLGAGTQAAPRPRREGIDRPPPRHHLLETAVGWRRRGILQEALQYYCAVLRARAFRPMVHVPQIARTKPPSTSRP